MTTRRDRPSRIAGALSELGPIGPLAVWVVAGPAVGAIVLAMTMADWLPVVEATGPIGFVVIGSVCAALVLCPTHAIALVGGFVFGAALGTVLAVGATTAGALCSYAALRWLSGTHLLEAIAARPRARIVHAALVGAGAGRTISVLALLRMSPLMPFGLSNLLFAALRVRPSWFFVGSFVGFVPRVIAVAIAGATLAELDLTNAHTEPTAIAIGVAATLAALWLIGRIARRALRSTLSGRVPV